MVGPLHGESHEHVCRAALAAQRAYGIRKPSVYCSGDAAIGITLYDLLPEDRFDRQPLKDERFMLVADVRLDNRAELVAMLGETAKDRANQSDAEVLFDCFRMWGERCLDRLVGDFAVAFHDSRANRLILARDPLGQRPLCYIRRGDGLAFASMPSGLIAGIRPSLDIDAFALRLAGVPLPGGRSYFSGVSSVKPGEILLFEGNRVTSKAYWQPLGQAPPAHRMSEWTELFRERLDTAVGSQLRSRSPVVASQLSSGYDSSAVTATAARMLDPGRELIALTAAPSPGLEWLVPKNRIADESSLASLTAAVHAIEHIVIRDEAPLLDPLLDSSRVNQEPFPNLFNFGWWTKILRTASSRGASSILSGSTGNFTISYGGVGTLPYMIRAGQWQAWWREARSAVTKNHNRWRGILMSSFEPWIPDLMTKALYRTFVGVPDQMRFSFVRAHLAEVGQAGSKARSALSGDLATDRLMWIRRSDPGVHQKGMLALSNVELRDPTADRRLLQFCLSLPFDQLLHDGFYRPLARRALADRLPEAVLNSPLRGYQGADWYSRLRQADALNLVDEVAASHSACELLDIPKLRRAIGEWPNPQNDGYETVFAFGRNLTDALAAGKFIADVEGNPSGLGV